MPQREVKVYHRRKKNKAVAAGRDDGIDVLPDESLEHVLSFLPSREAVQTCVLARRWRHLWRSTPALRITNDSQNDTLTDQEFDNLERFVNSLFLLRNHDTALDLCDFFIKPFDAYPDGIPQLSSWIQQALQCKCQVLRFTFKRDLMWCPIFSNLKTLLLNDWCVAIDFRPLIYFLQHAPLLERLTHQLDKAPENWVEAKESYTTSKRLVTCKKLKVVEIECEEFDERVQKVFSILSIYCVCIEKISVHWAFYRCSQCTVSRIMMIYLGDHQYALSN